MPQASPKEKLFFYFLLGMLSVLFAEVIAGSSPFPFFTPWGILIVFPLYLLHTLFFWYLIFNYGKPTLAALYAGGMLFGMYEAYITKVVWISYIPEGPLFTFMGIALWETLLLVLVWHAILAFFIPLFIGETFLTKSREITGLIPERIRKQGHKWFLFLIIFGGLFTSLNSPNLVHSFGSTFLSGGVVVLLMWWWKKKGKDTYSMRELLPTKKGFKIITTLLILLYIFLTLIIHLEKLPSLSAQATVWVLYVVLIFLFVKTIQKSRTQKIGKVSHQTTPKTAFKYLLLFVAFALIGEPLPLEIPMILASFALIVFPGLPLLIHTVKKAFG